MPKKKYNWKITAKKGAIIFVVSGAVGLVSYLLDFVGEIEAVTPEGALIVGIVISALTMLQNYLKHKNK